MIKSIIKNKWLIMTVTAILFLFGSLLVLQTTNEVKNQEGLDYEWLMLQESETRLEASLLIAQRRFNEAKSNKESIETELDEVYKQQRPILGFK